MADSQFSSWTKCFTFFPKFEMTNVFKYVQENGKDRALNKGYRFYADSYITDVWMKKRDDGVVEVRSKCYRSQKKNEEPHSIHIKLTSNSDLTDVNCTCTAGKAGVCNHVVALLYQLQHWSSMKIGQIPTDGSCTSKPQQWHKPRGKNIAPEAVMSSVFSNAETDRDGRKKTPVTCKLYDARGPGAKEVTSESIILMKEALKGASNIPFSYLVSHIQPEEETVLGKVVSTSPLSYQLRDHTPEEQFTFHLPPIPSQLETPIWVYPNLPFKIGSPLQDSLIDEHHKTFLSSLEVTMDQAHQIEMGTISQDKSPMWFNERRERLTASKFGVVLTRKSKPSLAMLRDIFVQKDLSAVSAIDYGKRKEPIAKQLYIKKMNANSGHKIVLFESGFCVNPAYPFLGATPDGKVIDHTAVDQIGLLEIKSVFKYRDMTLGDACLHQDFYMEKDNETFSLKPTHIYFYQVQGQMAVTGIKWCDFVVYTTKHIHVQRIPFDEQLWKDIMLPKLANFYFRDACPYLLSLKK